MKILTAGRWGILVPVLTLCLAATAFSKKAPERLTKLETDLQSFSYAIGMSMGRSLKTVPGDLDMAALRQGLEDARVSDSLLLTDENAQTIIQTEIKKRNDVVAQANESKVGSFMGENGKKPGVITTASGLQYEVLQPADGAKPTPESKVTVHYTGTLLDGTKFDSSVDRGEPASFPLSGVIPGWTEGLQLMTVGSKYRFWIPPALGYGANGAGGVIPPNSVLIFEVELISFE